MRIKPKEKPREIPLATASDLAEVSLKAAIEVALKHPHDGWADLVVHQSELRTAMRAAATVNQNYPALRVRVLTDTTLAHDDWRLVTRSVSVTSYSGA